jgi:NADPH:quinone reductase-like Zn-dependent oxidoreductase
MDMGLRKPKATGLGIDFAGTVEAVGRNVTQFKPGDEVSGGRTGAFAEYVAVREDRAPEFGRDLVPSEQSDRSSRGWM